MKYLRYCITLAIALLLISLLSPLPVFAANPRQVVQLQSTKSCQVCDLTGAYLPVSNLDYSYLLASDLSQANLSGASITFSNLSRARLNGTNLSYVNLKHTKMLLTDFSNAIFNKTIFLKPYKHTHTTL